MGSAAPAGWYSVPGGIRWWDGEQWTPHFRQPPPPINHVLHLLLTVLTFGVWGFVWALLAVQRASEVKAMRLPPR
jgi:hypothetical protein